jgi:hypothetical protein
MMDFFLKFAIKMLVRIKQTDTIGFPCAIMMDRAKAKPNNNRQNCFAGMEINLLSPRFWLNKKKYTK